MKNLTIALLCAALAGCSEKPNHSFKIGDRVVHVMAEGGVKGVVTGNYDHDGDLVYVSFPPYSRNETYNYGLLKLVERPTQPEAARQ